MMRLKYLTLILQWITLFMLLVPASPELYVNQPVETMASNFLGMYNLLEYAKNSKVSNLVYISSSEVYGISTSNNPLDGNYIGTVDHLSVRSSYASSKELLKHFVIVLLPVWNQNNDSKARTYLWS